ncbi:MAG: hypothetical protein RBS57_07665 [Desulforhabdus sp.]|nr:hypothetical protein [Desulforhabdus sp.]
MAKDLLDHIRLGTGSMNATIRIRPPHPGHLSGAISYTFLIMAAQSKDHGPVEWRERQVFRNRASSSPTTSSIVYIMGRKLTWRVLHRLAPVQPQPDDVPRLVVDVADQVRVLPA